MNRIFDPKIPAQRLERGAIRGRLFQIFLAICALAIVCWLILDHQPEDTASLSIAAPLPTGWSARVVEIERIGPAGDFNLRRRDGSWYMESPRPDIASKGMIRELLRNLEKLKPERTLSEDSLGGFGLDPPVTRILLRTYSEQEIEVKVGHQAPVSDGVYIQWTGMTDIGLINPRSILQFSDAPAFKWREPELLPPNNCAIDSIWIEWPGESARLAKVGSEEWIFAEPAGKEADGRACERTVAAFWRYNFSRFLDDDSGTLDLGLDPPNSTWIVFRCGSIDTLDIGGKIDENMMVARLRGRAPGEVRADLFDYLTSGVFILEMCHLFRGESDEIEKFVVTDGQRGRAYQKRDRKWVVKELSVEDCIAAMTGTPPVADGEEWVDAADPIISGDLQNLFWNKGSRWLETIADRSEFPSPSYSIHLWDQTGDYQWAYFSGDPSVEITSFSCQALGSRFPHQSIQFDQAKSIWRMLRRLEN